MSIFSKKNKIDDIKIYIVDDEEYYLNLIKVSLNKFGYNDITIFTSGEDCLSQIKIEEPNCVILDFLIKGSDFNGDNVLSLIKYKYPNIDVIILSGQEDITIATDMIKNGAYDYIVKNKMTFFNLNSNIESIKDKKIYESKLISGKQKFIFITVLVWVIGIIGLITYILK